MINREKLTEYLHQYLSCDQFSDYAPNGLQIEGRSSIKRIATAVTASLDVIEKAIHWQADALLVHHGYFWRGELPCLTRNKRQRIALILGNELNLFAYHLPLDCHKEVGNNVCLGQLLQVKNPNSHRAGSIENLLWCGTLQQTYSGEDFKHRLTQCFDREPLWIASNRGAIIKRIAWCTGAAQDYIESAAQLDVDAFISGEVSERTYYQAKELDIHYYAAGHHATERYGIQALGQHLQQSFDLEHQFIDSQNPI